MQCAEPAPAALQTQADAWSLLPQPAPSLSHLITA